MRMEQFSSKKCAFGAREREVCHISGKIKGDGGGY